ncbi:hypothetical protein Gpo141_00010925, partial [Globisporangium polare]
MRHGSSVSFVRPIPLNMEPHFTIKPLYDDKEEESSSDEEALKQIGILGQMARFVGRQRLYKVLLVVVAAVVAVNSLCA